MSTDMLDPTIHPEPETAGPETTRVATKRLSKWTLYWRRFSRNRGALIGLVIFVVLVLFAILGPFIARYDHIELDFLNLSTPRPRNTGSARTTPETTSSPRSPSACSGRS